MFGSCSCNENKLNYTDLADLRRLFLKSWINRLVGIEYVFFQMVLYDFVKLQQLKPSEHSGLL